MPQKSRVSRLARKDIDSIWDTVFDQSQSLAIADRVIEKIFEAFGLLGDAPQASHSRQDLTDQPLKLWILYRYLIVYMPNSLPVEIVTVLYGARNASQLTKALKGKF